MKLTSVITDYNPDWKIRYEDEKTRLKSVLSDVLIEVHHIGSTSIKGLAAKPEIDILITVSLSAIARDYSEVLSAMGYKRGGDLSEGHQFYKKNVDGVRTHKIHLCCAGHPEIEKYFLFREYLLSNKEVRDQYGALKGQLQTNNQNGIEEYLHGKAPFIEEVIRLAAR